MPALHPQVPTTDMEVTSIRLERELKERLKAMAGGQGYQALVRDILWQFVSRSEVTARPSLHLSQLRSTVAAIAQKPEICAITGQTIAPHEQMFLGLTDDNQWVTLHHSVLNHELVRHNPQAA
ncbi:MAG: hypothetical protein WCO45_14920 [Pseudanabaena sp. ELA607]